MEKLNLESQENQLIEKIKQIKQINTGSEQKAQLVLVIQGIKPAAELSLYKWNSVPEEVEQILQKIGLEYKKKEIDENNEKVTAQYAISQKRELVEKLISCNSSREYGELMGYPSTAIDGYESNNSYEGPLPEDIENSVFKLVFSKDHYEEEFEEVRKWNKAIEQYAPDLMKS